MSFDNIESEFDVPTRQIGYKKILDRMKPVLFFVLIVPIDEYFISHNREDLPYVWDLLGITKSEAYQLFLSTFGLHNFSEEHIQEVLVLLRWKLFWALWISSLLGSISVYTGGKFFRKKISNKKSKN